MFLYLVWFSLCSSLFWELGDNGVLKNWQFCPLSWTFHMSSVGYSDVSLALPPVGLSQTRQAQAF